MSFSVSRRVGAFYAWQRYSEMRSPIGRSAFPEPHQQPAKQAENMPAGNDKIKQNENQ
jgi:hypothetical protein